MSGSIGCVSGFREHTALPEIFLIKPKTKIDQKYL